jgi:predicted ATPase
VDWSHDLLAAPERALFRRMADFPGGRTGGFALEAAEVAGAGGAGDPVEAADVLDLLKGLVDKSLRQLGVLPPAAADEAGGSSDLAGTSRTPAAAA